VPHVQVDAVVDHRHALELAVAAAKARSAAATTAGRLGARPTQEIAESVPPRARQCRSLRLRAALECA
jgi:hypothetical protein